ncbi:MAG TPA: hypothetical protein VJN50_01565 [Actinomycetota bacterium]|nr:hypothetical protein [Actinomycetota bacterium]
MRTKLASTLLVALLALGTAACDKAKSQPDSDGTITTPPEESVGPIGTTKDEFRYQNAGLVAVLKFRGKGGTLQVENDSGFDLPTPGFYVLDARDGHEIEGTVEGSEPVPDGEKKTFQISVGEGFELENVGLVILLMGEDNYGAFVNV